MANQHPVILVHGILGFGPQELGPLSYWGSAFEVPSPVQRFEASVGPLSSAHDRACEMVAQIKGTRVDYGREHAERKGHNRYGKDFTDQGFVPAWSAERPVHLVGHSLGSPTIRCLQHLLAQDFWGWSSDQRWVTSVSTISGVSNGSTLVYFFDADERTGLLKQDGVATPILRLLEVFIGATGGLMDSVYSFDLEHWGFVRRPGESLKDYLSRVARSNFLWGRDNAVYSLTLQGAFADNGVWRTYPETYYFSYITEQTTKGLFSGYHYPDLRMNPAMLALATYIGRKRFEHPPIPVTDFNSADWWENDGAVSAYSQKYPHTNGVHPVGGEFHDQTPAADFQTGRWYFKWERGADHIDICLFPQLNQIDWQQEFYTNLFKRLAEL